MSSSNGSARSRKSRLRALEAHREDERKRMDDLLLQQQNILKAIKTLENDLEKLDENIEHLEELVIADGEGENDEVSVVTRPTSRVDLIPTQLDEHLTDPTSQTQQPTPYSTTSSSRPAVGRVSLDTQLTEPPAESQISEEDNDEGPFPSHSVATLPRPRSAGSSFGPLEITTLEKPKKRAAKPKSTGEPASAASASATLDAYFKPAAATASVARAHAHSATFTTTPTIAAAAAAAASGAFNSGPSRASTNEFSRTDFPWSNIVQELLQNTFRIQQFREHQREVINATISGTDVFVLMRTGGGKSLTYQLPALLEGRYAPQGGPGKITFVISPLLSLIKDQEDQMNQFAPGSAVSFSSSLPGGSSEQARRWDLVRDPDQGVCLVFVTPEKVHKSNKLKSEMQNLHSQGRLGRIVIDEAHCASSMGHDFRPDYTKLGILKSMFCTVPILAVTATASDRVRNDVCNILQINQNNYAFFRSTANRPNLTYEVRIKKSTGDSVLDDMAAFIKDRYPKEAGIVYTLSKKDADTVAKKLMERGVGARSYHSEVSATQKDLIHQNWMAGKTQVVVATIAFGLGINKPNVRFVLHHSLSKTLEAYYQESGRAGRDGKPAHCILYYSPKDVIRMAKMVHGESSIAEGAFWSMVRYASQFGSEDVCRYSILRAMGEGSERELQAALQRQKEEGGLSEFRDVGKHAKTVAQLLKSKTSHREKVTLNMLIKDWRTKPDNALPCVKANPPGTDLNAEECEHVIIAMLVQNIFCSKIVFNSYDSVVYLQLGQLGPKLLASPQPKVSIWFPKRQKAAAKNGASSAKSKKTKARKADSDDVEQASAKPTAKKKRKRTSPSSGGKAATKTRKQSTTSKAKPKATKRTKGATAASKKQETAADPVIIDMMDSSDEESVEEKTIVSTSKPTTRASRATVQEKESISSDDDSEFEFSG